MTFPISPQLYARRIVARFRQWSKRQTYIGAYPKKSGPDARRTTSATKAEAARNASMIVPIGVFLFILQRFP